jgi:pimeloyl-ACP methyl ester carboxylesterase
MEMLAAPSARITGRMLAVLGPKYQQRGQELWRTGDGSRPPPTLPAVYGATAGDGTGIAYEVAGSGPALVLLHGITEDRAVWEPVLERLGDDFTCIRLDARGHGDSDSAVDYEALTMAGDIGAVVEAAGVMEAPALVGHSLGGFLATVYAAVSPTRAVVSIDQTLRIPDFAGLIRPLEDDLRGPRFVETITVFGDSLGVDRLRPDVLDQLHARRRAARQDMVLGVWRAVFDSTDVELLAIIEGQVLPNVTAPYLAIHGSDPGPGYEAWLTKLIPTATVEVCDGYGHWLHLVDPDRFVARVRDFLAAT